MQLTEEFNYITNSIVNPDKNQNLEKTVLDAENEDEEFIDKIFSDEKKILKATVREILNDINMRQEISKRIFLRTDIDIGNCHIKLDLCKRPYLVEKDPKLTAQLESKVLELEQEKRKEQVEFWKDIMFLKKYLMSALQDYWLAFRRTQILQNDVLG